MEMMNIGWKTKGRKRWLLFIAVISILFFILVPSLHARIIYVPDNYSTIQSAVEAAQIGDTVVVRNGIYYENVILNKKISLIGENFPTIDARRYGGSAIIITTDGCIVEGFRLNNTFYPEAGVRILSNSNIVRWNLFERNTIGILIKNSSENLLSNNYFYRSNIIGIFLKSSVNNSIQHNYFKGCGIFVGNSYGNNVEDNYVNGKPLIYLENLKNREVTGAGQVILINCSQITVRNCNINNTTVGIELWKSYNCTIKDNKLLSNYFGISLWHSSGNTIKNNSFEDRIKVTMPKFCSNSGISLRYSSENTILNNSFIDCGLFIWDSYRNKIDENTVNGKPLIYLENEKGKEINDAGQVILVNCSEIMLINCSIQRVNIGVELWKSKYCSIINSRFRKNIFGVFSLRSHINEIIGNTYESNYGGILLEKSLRNKVMNNSFERNIFGVYLTNSSRNKILNNNFSDCGLYVEFSYHNEVRDNYVNGKPLVYLEDERDKEINDAGQVILVNCRGINVRNCDIRNTTGGIRLWRSHNCTIKNNSILNNNWGGIHLWRSSHNTISNNTVENVDEAIHLKFSSDNKILNNTINDAVAWGIFLWKSSENRISRNRINGGVFALFLRYSSENSIFLNSFESTEHGIYSYCSDNLWNTTRPVSYIYNGSTYKNYMGNYWSDYSDDDMNRDGIGEKPYKVDDNDYDYYPLIRPLEFFSRAW